MHWSSPIPMGARRRSLKARCFELTPCPRVAADHQFGNGYDYGDRGTIAFAGFHPAHTQTRQFAGVELGSTTNFDVTCVGFMLAGNSVAIVWMEVVDGTSTMLGSDSALRGDVSTSEGMILEISLDQSIDSALARYSLDGGSSFVEQGSWDSPPVTSGFDFDQDLFAQLSASAQTLPEPSRARFGATGLLILALRRRVRNVSAQTSNPA